MFKLKCVNCGSVFRHSRANTKYCSEQCRQSSNDIFSRSHNLDNPKLTSGQLYEYFIRRLDCISPMLDSGTINVSQKELCHVLRCQAIEFWNCMCELTGKGLLRQLTPSSYRVYRRRRKHHAPLERATANFRRSTNPLKEKHKRAYEVIASKANPKSLWSKFSLCDIPQKPNAARQTISELHAYKYIRVTSEKNNVITARILIND